MAQRQPSSTGGMGDAVWGSADAERFSLGRVDPTLRRLRAPLSGATLKVRPKGLLALRAGWASRLQPFGRVASRAAAPGRQPYIGRG